MTAETYHNQLANMMKNLAEKQPRLVILEFDLEIIDHHPYSPNLSPTEYSPGFYVKGMNELPLRWQKCIDASGVYFE